MSPSKPPALARRCSIPLQSVLSTLASSSRIICDDVKSGRRHNGLVLDNKKHISSPQWAEIELINEKVKLLQGGTREEGTLGLNCFPIPHFLTTLTLIPAPRKPPWNLEIIPICIEKLPKK